MKNKGVFLAALFSYGCRQAERLGVSPLLKKYVKSEGKYYSDEEIKEILSHLISFFFYKIIAFANDIDDPFDEEVVKAYWIGNQLLEKVELFHIRTIFEEFKKNGWDPVILGFALKPIMKEELVHHNVYTTDPLCRVSLKDGYFWHLGEARMKAVSEDIENFKRYGEGKV